MRAENKTQMKLRQRNIALTVAYDGTNYHGFQWQKPPRIAVQNVLEERLSKIFGEPIELAASGRTDAGVHAFGNEFGLIHFTYLGFDSLNIFNNSSN